MKEMFTLKGIFNGTEAILRWKSGKISGTEKAVQEYWRLENEHANKQDGLGPIPGDSCSDYHLNPLAANCIFNEILQDNVVIAGQNFYDDMLGKNDPPDAIY